MRVKDIKINKVYKWKTNESYPNIKAIKILKPKEGENTNNFIVVKCHHSTNMNFDFAFIRYIRPRDIDRK